jgi:hypothetical protein
MDRVAANILTQWGTEVTPGTAVAANRFVTAVDVMIDMDIENRPRRSRGSNVETSSIRGKKLAKGSYDGILCYNSLPLILNGLLPVAASQQIGAIEAYRYRYQPPSKQQHASRKTYTWSVGDDVAREIFAYGQIAGMQCELTQDDSKVTGPVFARFPTLSETAQPAITSEILERAVERDDINIYLSTDLATLWDADSQLLDTDQEMLSIGEKWTPRHVHNRALSSFKKAVGKPYTLDFSYTTEHESVSRAFLASLIASNVEVFMGIECQGLLLGNNGGTDVFELIRYTMAGKLTSPESQRDDEGGNGGVFGKKYNFKGLHSPTLGTAYEIEVINSIAAY